MNKPKVILLKLSIAGFLINPMLVACSGQSSNPIAKYNLQSAPATEVKSQTQTIVQPELFSVSLDGTNQVNNGNLVEGEQGEALIRVIVKSTKITRYSIELTDFPVANRPQLKPTARPDIFVLSWKPPVGIIAAGTWGLNLKAQIQVTVTEATDLNLNGMTKSETLNLTISRNSAQPKILGRTDLSGGIDEGQTITFTVDVEDPGTNTSPRLPEIQVTPYIYSNTEAYRADGSRYLTPDLSKEINPLRGQGNKWRFFYTMNVDQLPLDRDRVGKEIPNAPDVDVCFQMRAVSVIGTMSEQQQICYKARYSVQPPTVTADLAQNEVRAGIENQITFKAFVAHKLSVVSLKNASQQIANLPGKKDLTCQAEATDKQNSLVCVLKWTPPCTKLELARTLNLKFESVLGAKTKASTFKKEFTVLQNAEACKPEATKPTVASQQGRKL